MRNIVQISVHYFV